MPLKMRIQIVSPGGELHDGQTRTGNRSTATQWGRLLNELGHEVTILNDFQPGEVDLLIALHGGKSVEAVRSFRNFQPDGKLIVGLAGTDIYPDPDPQTLESIAAADGLIALQEKAIEKVPKEHRSKVAVILQSAIPFQPAPSKSGDTFDVSIIGHLREVKAPLLLAGASRKLPPESRIRVLQAGDILESPYHDAVRAETENNPRYRYLGQLDRQSTAQLIASSHIMCMTSVNEGGARVVGEAIVNRTPILSTCMDGSIGMLGESYPGYFPVGDREALAELLWKCESEPEFLSALTDAVSTLAPGYTPEKERKDLATLLARVCKSG